MMKDRNIFVNQVKSKDLTTARADAYAKIKAYSETYYDTSKSKEDLKDAANEALRGLSKVIDLQYEQTEQLVLMGQYLSEMILGGKPKEPRN